jgi:predicted GNAT family N-acyltransferase
VEGGETLLNKQGYQRWCKQPVNGLSQTHFWQTYKSLGFETQDAVESYMEATVSQIQSLYDVDEGNHGPVLKHLLGILVNKG